MSWVDDLTVDLEHSVRVIEAKLVARTPKMLRGAIKPLSDGEVREISASISWAVSSAILKAHDAKHHTNRKGAA
jgi:hypothetical protein